MANKVRIWAELSGGEVVTIPDWVKTGKDLETFVYDYVDLNISAGYELINDSLDIK